MIGGYIYERERGGYIGAALAYYCSQRECGNFMGSPRAGGQYRACLHDGVLQLAWNPRRLRPDPPFIRIRDAARLRLADPLEWSPPPCIPELHPHHLRLSGGHDNGEWRRCWSPALGLPAGSQGAIILPYSPPRCPARLFHTFINVIETSRQETIGKASGTKEPLGR